MMSLIWTTGVILASTGVDVEQDGIAIGHTSAWERQSRAGRIKEARPTASPVEAVDHSALGRRTTIGAGDAAAAALMKSLAD
jgi:hypothetical protein